VWHSRAASEANELEAAGVPGNRRMLDGRECREDRVLESGSFLCAGEALTEL